MGASSGTIDKLQLVLSVRHVDAEEGLQLSEDVDDSLPPPNLAWPQESTLPRSLPWAWPLIRPEITGLEMSLELFLLCSRSAALQG